jgi:WD40 repeat protein
MTRAGRSGGMAPEAVASSHPACAHRFLMYLRRRVGPSKQQSNDSPAAGEAPSPNEPPRDDDGETRTLPPAESDAATTWESGEHSEMYERSGAHSAPDHRLPAPLQYRDSRRYEVIAEHGRGGLGRVMRATDRELGRPVAIKELLTRTTSGELRFFREAMITARLEHPGIVPVHEAGRWTDGTPFYAMKLVRGRSLKELIAGTKSLQERLRLLPHVAAVADAVAYAHSCGIIHRDLKPANVIVGDYGETIVIDWGLAKQVDSRDEPASEDMGDGSPNTPGITQAGTVLGTPAYMAPEQARGDTSGTAADVFALGAILVDAIAGVDKDVAGAIHRIPANNRELRSIARKAMAHDPDDRYKSASDFRDDLARLARGEPVSAHSYSAVDKTTRFIRKHAVWSASLTLALVTAGIFGVLFTGRVVEERRRTAAANLRLQKTESELIAGRHELILEQVASKIVSDPTTAVAWLSRYDGSESDRAQELGATAASNGVALHVLTRESTAIGSAAVVSQRPLVVAYLSYGGVVYIWRPGTEPTKIAENVDPTLPLASTSVHQMLAFADLKGRIVRYHLATGKTTTMAHNRGQVRSLSFVGASQRVFAASSDGQVGILGESLHSVRPGIHRAVANHAGDTVAICKASRSAVLLKPVQMRQISIGPCSDSLANTMAFSEDGKVVAVASRARLAFYSTEDGRALSSWPVDSAGPVITSGTDLIVATSDRSLYRMPFASGSLLTMSRTNARVTALARTGDGTVLAGLEDGSVYVFSERHSPIVVAGHSRPIEAVIALETHGFISVDPQEVRVLRTPSLKSWSAPSVALFNVVYSEDGQRMVTDSQEGSLFLISTSSPAVTQLRAHDQVAFGVSRIGDSFLSGGWDGAIRRLDGMTSTELVRSKGEVRSFAVTGDHLLVGLSTGALDLVSLREERVLRQWSLPQPPYRVAAGAGNFIAGAMGGDVYLIDADTGPRTLGKHDGAVYAVAFFPMFNQFSSIGTDGMLRFWRSDSGIEAGSYRLGQHCDALSAGSIVAVAGCDGTNILVFDVRKRVVKSQRLIASEYYLVKISPSGTMVAITSVDGKVLLWNLEDGGLAVATAGKARVTSASFSPDGTEVAVTAGGMVHSWRLKDLLFVPRPVRAWAADLFTVDAQAKPANLAPP